MSLSSPLANGLAAGHEFMQSKCFRISRCLAMASLLVTVIALSGTTQASCGSYLHTRYSSPAHQSGLRMMRQVHGQITDLRAEAQPVNSVAPMMPFDSSWPEQPCQGPGCRQHSIPLSSAPLAVHPGPDSREADVLAERESGACQSQSCRPSFRGPTHATAGYPQPIEIPPEV